MSRVITPAELKEHTGADSHWIAVEGKVYDVTKFVNEHPGGPGPLKNMAGKDATFPFKKVGHSADAIELQKSFLVGTLKASEGWTMADYALNIGVPVGMFLVLWLYARRF